METFSHSDKEKVLDAYNGYCAYPGCTNLIHSLHHKLPNTKYNRKKFPNFIHSVFNAVPLCFHDHTNNAHQFNITEKQAHLYEDSLRESLLIHE